MADLKNAFMHFSNGIARYILRKPRESKKKRIKVLDIDGALLLSIFQDLCTGSVIWHPKDGYTVRMEGIPEGAKVVDVLSESFGSAGRAIRLVVEHESFPECREFERPEPLQVTCSREKL